MNHKKNTLATWVIVAILGLLAQYFGQEVIPAAKAATDAPAAVWPGAMFARYESGCGDFSWCLTTEDIPEQAWQASSFVHPKLGWLFGGTFITQVTLGFGRDTQGTCGSLHSTDPSFHLKTTWGQEVKWHDDSDKGLKLLPELVGTGNIVISATAPSGEVSQLWVYGVTCGTVTPTLTASPTQTTVPSATPTNTATATPGMTLTPAPSPTPTLTPEKTAVPEPLACPVIEGWVDHYPVGGQNITFWVTMAENAIVRLYENNQLGNKMLVEVAVTSGEKTAITQLLQGGNHYVLMVLARGQTEVCELGSPTGLTATAEPSAPAILQHVFVPQVSR